MATQSVSASSRLHWLDERSERLALEQNERVFLPCRDSCPFPTPRRLNSACRLSEVRRWSRSTAHLATSVTRQKQPAEVEWRAGCVEISAGTCTSPVGRSDLSSATFRLPALCSQLTAVSLRLRIGSGHVLVSFHVGLHLAINPVGHGSLQL